MPSKISLCMIVRDEAAHLAKCLESVTGIVDEIIVVDTGSKDDSPAIAKSYGATVIHEAWEDNFSIPRNTSLDHAGGEWILVLDADETLSRESRDKLKPATDNDIVIGYRVLIQMDPEWSDMRSLRLFRNQPSIRYQGIFHEELTITPDQFSFIADSDIRILHKSFSRDIFDKKLSRNIDLLTKHLNKYPDDAYQMLDLARIYLEIDKLYEAKQLLDRAAACLSNPLPRRSELYIKICKASFYAYKLCLLAKQGCRPEQMLDVCAEALSLFPECPLYLYETGRIYYTLKAYEDAISCFTKCLDTGDQKQIDITIFYPRDIAGSKALAGLGHCLFKQKEYIKSEQYFKKSYALKNDDSVKTMLKALQVLKTKKKFHDPNQLPGI